MSKTQETQAWPDMAIGLYDKLTGRGAEISYDFDHFTVKVPSSTSPEVEYATWVLNGTFYQVHSRLNKKQLKNCCRNAVRIVNFTVATYKTKLGKGYSKN